MAMGEAPAVWLARPCSLVFGMRQYLLHLGQKSWAWSWHVHVSEKHSSLPWWCLLVPLGILAFSSVSAHCRSQITGPSWDSGWPRMGRQPPLQSGHWYKSLLPLGLPGSPAHEQISSRILSSQKRCRLMAERDSGSLAGRQVLFLPWMFLLLPQQKADPTVRIPLL